MIGKAKRLITEEKDRNAYCTNCNEQNTLVVKVYSDIFILRIFPFVLGKSTELYCTNCLKVFDANDKIDYSTKQKVENIKGEAKHAWFLYLGYIFILAAAIIGMVIQPK